MDRDLSKIRENDKRKKIQWPNDAKVCVTFTIALEAFNKTGSFKKTKALDVNLASINHANYGGNVGIWRLMEILDRNDVTSTVILNGLAGERWPEAVRTIHQMGSEIAAHGYTNEISMTDLTPDQQRDEVRKVSKLIESITGERAYGWQGPGGGFHTAETVSILAQEGYTWSGDQSNEDLPYLVNAGGNNIVILPKSWFYNDKRVWNDGATSGSIAFEAFKEGFDFIYQEALRGSPGRIDATVHAEYAGRGYIAPVFERIIRYVKQFGNDVWIANCNDIAQHVIESKVPAEIYDPMR